MKEETEDYFQDMSSLNLFQEEEASTSINKPPKGGKQIDLYTKALHSLHENSLPSEIPCRDAEKLEIERFLREGLANDGQS